MKLSKKNFQESIVSRPGRSEGSRKLNTANLMMSQVLNLSRRSDIMATRR